jgi:hypothetical protein
MAKQHPDHEPFEEVRFMSPFVSPKLAYETERPLPPSLKLNPCPSGHQNIVLDSGRDSTLILHENFYAMDIPIATTLETKEMNSTDKHENFSF